MRKTIEEITKVGCSGCTACMTICPVNAIKMEMDNQGFKYPNIDHEKCINCGLCLKVCPYKQEILHSPSPEAYAVKHIDKEDQLSSTSGGFASAVTETVIEDGGEVFGVLMTPDYKINTIHTNQVSIAKHFKGSKYVQTDLLNSFSETSELLLSDSPVAFFGTSCHIDGLYHYLNEKRIDTSKLITIDFFCHGVPSPKLFKEFCQYASKKKPLLTYLFRTKTKGWGTGSNRYCPTLVYENKTVTDSPLAWAWINFFFSNNCLRPHCYECPYASSHKRSADITMGDFWGLKNAIPAFFDEKGVSLVVINTEKGHSFFEKLKNIVKDKCPIESAIARQGNYHNPSKKSEKYNQFWSDYHNKGFEYVLRRYTGYNRVLRIKKMFKRILTVIGIFKNK